MIIGAGQRAGGLVEVPAGGPRWRPGRVLVLLLALAGVTVGVSGCRAGEVGDSCHAEFRSSGPYVRGGEVVDELRVWCSPSPASHTVSAHIEYAPFDTFSAYGRSVVTDRIPDADGFVVSPHFACESLAGRYRAVATVRATDQAGRPATVTAEGLTITLGAADCARS